MSAIGAFLAAAGFRGIANWIWIALVAALVAAIWAFVAIADRRHENALETAAAGGATGAVVAGQTQTLDQLGDANNAQQDLRERGERSAARHDQCLRDARDPAGCERYRPLAQP
jgi:flagellar biosynthesis/type III secretory pathway M-ring protein FliF/YscJ